MLSVLFNDVVGTLFLTDVYKISHFSMKLNLLAGDNTLQFYGDGVSDNFEIISTNVKLTSFFTIEILLLMVILRILLYLRVKLYFMLLVEYQDGRLHYHKS